MNLWPIATLLKRHLSNDKAQWTDVATRLGYKDPKQGVRELEKVIETGQCPRRIRSHLARVLGIPWSEVEVAVLETQKVRQERGSGNALPTIHPEDRPLLEHAGLLIENSHLIMNEPRAWFCRLHTVFAAKWAGIHPCLGELLRAWQEGVCLGACPACGDKLHFYGSSPASGNLGICPSCQTTRTAPGTNCLTEFYQWKHSRTDLPNNRQVITETVETSEFSFGCGLRPILRQRRREVEIVKPFSLQEVVDWVRSVGARATRATSPQTATPLNDRHPEHPSPALT